MPSGGPRQPQNPAAVSAPGSGRRTDGGAGSKKQPLRLPSGGAYGERKAATEQQQAAPMAAGQPASPGMGAPGGGPGVQAQPGAGVFGPTEQTNVPPQSAGGPRELMVEEPQLFLRVLYSEFPHPAIAALLRRTGANG